MKPELVDLDKFEQHASDQEPSIAGSWVITMQAIEHFFNMMVNRDPLNNEIRFQLLSETYKTIASAALQDVKRPVPLDQMHQLYLYAEKSIKAIIANPSRKLVKEMAYVTPNQLKSPRTKTMNWIANQPGRNIREKLAGKRVLSEKNVFIVDTKENQAFVRVMKQLAKEFQNRITLGVELGTYDSNAADEKRIEEIKRFLNAYKKMRFSELGDIDTTKPIMEPNNKLISDKHYAPIWKLHNEINNRKHKVKMAWDHAVNRYENILMDCIVMRLAAYEQIQTIDFPMRLEDLGEEIITETFEHQDDGVAVFTFYYESTGVSGEEVIVETVQLGKRRLICRKASGEQIYVPATHFKSIVGFGKMKSGDRLTISSSKATEHSRKDGGFNSITINANKKKIIVNELHKTQATFTLGNEMELTYSIEARLDGVKFNRGIPIAVTMTVDGESETIDSYADAEGLRVLSDIIIDRIREFSSFELKMKETEKTESETIENIGIDFTKPLSTLYVNGNMEVLSTHALIHYEQSEQHLTTMPDGTSIYESDRPVYSFDKILDVENEQYNSAINNFTTLMRQLRSEQELDKKTPMLYLVPDNIDEFAQVDIKKSMNIYYKKNLPIWRSVCAALAAVDEKEELLQRIIVIDTQGPEASATQLKWKTVEDEPYFMHYPAYPLRRDVAKKLTFRALCASYLGKYLHKYGLPASDEVIDHLVSIGKVEQLFTDKQARLCAMFKGSAPFQLFFDEDIYKQVTNEWLLTFRSFLQSLKKTAIQKDGPPITNMIILLDFEVDEAALLTIASEVMGDIPSILFNTKAALAAIMSDELLQKLEKGETIWLEYLPDLSLDVVRDGTYGVLPLIQNESIGNTMGASAVFKVKETLVLPRGQKEYRFPLKRGGSLGNDLHAMVQNPAFPLNEDLEVDLVVEYKYGYENSYRLVMRPIVPHRRIKELEAEWVPEEIENVQLPGYLSVPDGHVNDEEIERDIAFLDDIFNQAALIRDTFINNGIVRTYELNSLQFKLFIGIYRIRRLLQQEAEHAKTYVAACVNRPEYDFLAYMSEDIPERIQQGTRQEVFVKLFKSAKRFVNSFGEYVPLDIKENTIAEARKNAYNVDALYALFYRNSDEEEIVDVLESYIIGRPKIAIRSLRDSVWRDSNLLWALYNKNFKIIEVIYGAIKAEFKKTIHRGEIDNILYVRDCCEVLLALLAMRNEPKLEFMKVGSPKMEKLAKNIRDIDQLAYDIVGKTIPTLLQFDLQKPEGLWKMGDIGFVLHTYITGDLKDNLISVRDMTFEEEGMR